MTSPTSYTPDFVTPPGDTLAELLEERKMTQSELAQRMGRPIKTINEIIHGKKAITAETAVQLERVLGAPASFWLSREQRYQEFQARQAANESLRSQQEWLDHFPIKDMQAKGWLPQLSDKSELLLALLQFFGLAAPDNWKDVWSDCLVNYRKTPAYESSDYALSAWLRQGERQAQDIVCNPYDEAGFRQLLENQIRALTFLTPDKFERPLLEMCAAVGVAVALVPQVEGARVSGATRWLSKDKALLQVSFRYKFNDQFWFTFFHEAGHILLHGKRDIFINAGISEGFEDEADLDAKEQAANRFAADTLIPAEAYADFVRGTRRFSKVAVHRFAEGIGIAPGIVVGRLQFDGHVPRSHLNGLKQKLAWVE